MREAFETIDLPLSRRRFLRAGLAGLAAGSVWQGPPTRVRAAQGGTLVATSPGDLQFDPYFAQTRAWIVQGQIFSALFDYQGKNPFAPSPQLAESWKETEKTLTIKLRKGVKFHNGRDLTSQDIIDNVNRAKDKAIGHYLFDYFDPSVDGAEAIDRETVKITYKQAYPLKLDDLTLLYIIPKEAMADVATKPVGSGPFKFVELRAGRQARAPAVRAVLGEGQAACRSGDGQDHRRRSGPHREPARWQRGLRGYGCAVGRRAPQDATSGCR